MFAPRVKAPTAKSDPQTGPAARAAKAPQQMSWPPRSGTAERMLTLQRIIGLTRSRSDEHGTQEANSAPVAGPKTASIMSWDLLNIPVFPANRTSRPQTSPPLIQPKLVVGQVNDPLGYEAHRVADQVMRTEGRTAPARRPFLQHLWGRQGLPASHEQSRLPEWLPPPDAVHRVPDANAPVGPVHDLAAAPVHATGAVHAPRGGPVDAPGGALEREADQFAEQAIEASTFPQRAFGRGGAEGAEPSAEAAGLRKALAAPGQPLDRATRDLMEPRFGFDFSQVRVHSDAAAAQSARALSARAYTAGCDIVFGPGEFQPSTEKGRHLLAHELTHVVQQSRPSTPFRLQRKEVRGSAFDALRRSLPPEDWHSYHRVEWQHVSATGTERQLSPRNTFMRAAFHNTQNLRPGEYQTINERHDYYDLISYVIQHDPGTPAAVRDVRFFHATTSVTGSPGIGSVDKPIGHAKLGAETRQILRDVNVELFALNMRVIRDLLTDWREPRDPQNPAGRINTFDFDIRMVETEQGAVEDYITQNASRFTPDVVEEINATMDPEALGQFFNFSRQAFRWAIEALAVPALDFTIRDHRQAIGFASVHIFHRKSKQDYLAFMRGRAPTRPPNHFVVGNPDGITLNDGIPGPLLSVDLPQGTLVEVIDWSHDMGPHLPGDVYAGKVEVRVLAGERRGTVGWTSFDDLR